MLKAALGENVAPQADLTLGEFLSLTKAEQTDRLFEALLAHHERVERGEAVARNPRTPPATVKFTCWEPAGTRWLDARDFRDGPAADLLLAVKKHATKERLLPEMPEILRGDY